jgi:hypothetical protein
VRRADSGASCIEGSRSLPATRVYRETRRTRNAAWTPLSPGVTRGAGREERQAPGACLASRRTERCAAGSGSLAFSAISAKAETRVNYPRLCLDPGFRRGDGGGSWGKPRQRPSTSASGTVRSNPSRAAAFAQGDGFAQDGIGSERGGRRRWLREICSRHRVSLKVPVFCRPHRGALRTVCCHRVSTRRRQRRAPRCAGELLRGRTIPAQTKSEAPTLRARRRRSRLLSRRGYANSIVSRVAFERSA